MSVRLGVFVLASAVGVLGCRALLGPIVESSALPVPASYVSWSCGLLFGHWWIFRVADPRGWDHVGLGLRALRPRGLLLGLLLGTAAVGVPSLALLALGWLRVEPAVAGSWLRSAAGTLLVLLPAALWEELLTRGYLFALVRERWGARRAVVATSVIFGALHLRNAGASVQSIALVTLAGIFLGAILVRTSSLYASWLAHVAWNFVMSAIFHVAVSGIEMTAPNYRTVDAGPDWATGGGWGPEAGIFTALALLVGTYIMLRPGRRGV